nr:Bacterial regulatory proteins, tetR family [uncultured bacterium]
MKPAVSPDIFPPRGHEAKRMSIIDAAASVFCREGFAGANIDLIAAEAGVSRQTIYNHHRDKEKLFMAVVRDLTERCNAGIFATFASFPDQPRDLEADLIGFAVRMNQNCICNRDGKFLRKLIQTEGERYPELFAEWPRPGAGPDMARTCRPFRPPRPCRPPRGRRSRCRRAPVPGAGQRRTADHLHARRHAFGR